MFGTCKSPLYSPFSPRRTKTAQQQKRSPADWSSAGEYCNMLFLLSSCPDSYRGEVTSSTE